MIEKTKNKFCDCPACQQWRLPENLASGTFSMPKRALKEIEKNYPEMSSKITMTNQQSLDIFIGFLAVRGVIALQYDLMQAKAIAEILEIINDHSCADCNENDCGACDDKNEFHASRDVPENPCSDCNRNDPELGCEDDECDCVNDDCDGNCLTCDPEDYTACEKEEKEEIDASEVI